MKFTLNWLKEYIEVPLSADELANALTMRGLEVDSITPIHEGLRDIKVAMVLALHSHPQNPKLLVCEVAYGTGGCQVICGAPNVRIGMFSALALPGTILPNGVTVIDTVITGVPSAGMLCSEQELGISDDHAGIMDLPLNLTIGQPLSEALALTDIVFEVDLTPNRPDCASVIGIAREVAAVCHRKLHLKQPDLISSTEISPFSVHIIAKDDCPRYTGQLLTNVQVGPSPLWLQNRLRAIGIRPINNVVDITNLVLMEYGQPLHAFDYAKLAGQAIVVRRPKGGELITTLDGIKRSLDPEMLLICDAEKPIAIAGIMGGQDTEVTLATREVLLESAYFNPISIRRTGRRLKLSTEASYRFERGTDPQGVPKALRRAVQLLLELTGATPVGAEKDEYPAPISFPAIEFRLERTNDLLGTNLTKETIVQVLNSIHVDIENMEGNSLLVRPPSFRVDLLREIDLIEEVARLIGYNDIPTSLPLVPMNFPEQDALQELQKKTRYIMTSLGFYEAINYSFVAEQGFDQLLLAPDHSLRSCVRLLNPLSDDQNLLRTTMILGLLENAKRNINRQQVNIKLFEIGKVFHPKAGQPQPTEVFHLAGVMSGQRMSRSLMLHYGGEQDVDLFDIKGAMEILVTELGLAEVTFVAAESDLPYVESSSTVRIFSGDKEVGVFGRIKTQAVRNFGIKQDVYIFDLCLNEILQAGRVTKSFRSLPRFPAVNRDLSVVVKENVAAGEILDTIQANGGPLLEKAEIFDVYQGKSIEPGHKSVAFSLGFRSATQTLDEKTVSETHNRITELIISRFGGQLREE